MLKKHEIYEIYDEYQDENDYENNRLLPTKGLAVKKPQEYLYAKITQINPCSK